MLFIRGMFERNIPTFNRSGTARRTAVGGLIVRDAGLAVSDPDNCFE